MGQRRQHIREGFLRLDTNQSIQVERFVCSNITRVQTYDIINMKDKTRMHIQTVTVVPQFNRLSSDEKTQATYPTNSCKYSLKLLKIPRWADGSAEYERAISSRHKMASWLQSLKRPRVRELSKLRRSARFFAWSRIPAKMVKLEFSTEHPTPQYWHPTPQSAPQHFRSQPHINLFMDVHT